MMDRSAQSGKLNDHRKSYENKEALAWTPGDRSLDQDNSQRWKDDGEGNWRDQSPEYQYPDQINSHPDPNYGHSAYDEEKYGNEVDQDPSCNWPSEEAQYLTSNDGVSQGAQGFQTDEPNTAEEQQELGFVSRGRLPDRHVPPRDFPHPQPNDPKLAHSPVYGQGYPSNFLPANTGSSAQSRDPYAPYVSPYQGLEPANDLVVPHLDHSNQAEDPYPPRAFFSNIRPVVDPSTYDDFELPSTRRQDPKHSETSTSSQASSQNVGGDKVHKSNEECADHEDMGNATPEWCSGESRDFLRQSGAGESNVIEFGVVGSPIDTFWPKPGDIMILANERKGCPWPAFDGHMEIYVDDNYFSKTSVALQWNYDFKEGDIVLRFGDFDRHWRWRANDHIYVFLRDNEEFYLVSRQAAQELHPLDFRFVDPHQRPVHTVQYHLQPRIGDFVLRKGTDDSYLWETSWWHPGGDSHLLLKHLKEPSYPQGPHPKYRWTFHWYRRGFQFHPEDILLRVGYESAEDNMHSYCVCEIYFRGKDGLWTFQGRDDYSFGPPSQA